MKLLWIVQRIVDLFPASTHIESIGLKEADDSTVWDWAKRHEFTIVSKDTDFHQRAIMIRRALGKSPRGRETSRRLLA